MSAAPPEGVNNDYMVASAPTASARIFKVSKLEFMASS
jgi:hypothetical protein